MDRAIPTWQKRLTRRIRLKLFAPNGSSLPAGGRYCQLKLQHSSIPNKPVDYFRMDTPGIAVFKARNSSGLAMLTLPN